MFSLFFERPIALLLCWTLVQFFLVCLWSWRRTPTFGRTAVGGLIVGPLLLMMSYLVVTPGEEVAATCFAVAKAVDEGDMGAIASAVSPGFEAADLDRDAFLERVEAMLTRFRVDHPRLSAVVVETSGDNGVTTLSATCRIRSQEVTFDALPTRWRVRFRRHSGAWLITSLEPIPVPPLNLRRLEDCFR